MKEERGWWRRDGNGAEGDFVVRREAPFGALEEEERMVFGGGFRRVGVLEGSKIWRKTKMMLIM